MIEITIANFAIDISDIAINFIGERIPPRTDTNLVLRAFRIIEDTNILYFYLNVWCIVFFREVPRINLIGKSVTHLYRFSIEETCFIPLTNIAKRISECIKQILIGAIGFAAIALKRLEHFQRPHLLASLRLFVNVEHKGGNKIHFEAHLLQRIRIKSFDGCCSISISLGLVIIGSSIVVCFRQPLVSCTPCGISRHNHNVYGVLVVEISIMTKAFLFHLALFRTFSR